MILNPNAKKVLCFGDSLTWGHFHSGIRFSLQDRWTYKLQELLGDDFDIQEEGLRSRTTVIDDPDNLDRNGFPYFRACFESHDPVSYLIYMMGTNDTKIKFNVPVESIVEGISQKIDWVKNFNLKNKTETQIIVIAPPQINLTYLKKISAFDATSNEKIISLGTQLKTLAEQKNILFIDLSKIMAGSENDGVHLSAEDNGKIADLIKPLISK